MNNTILITGNDELSIKKEALLLSESLLENFDPEASLEIIDADTEKKSPLESVGAFLDSVNTPSFFSEKRFIWLKNFPFSMLYAKEEKAKEDIRNILFEAITKESENKDLKLFITGHGLPSKSPIFKFVQENGQLIELNVVSGEQKDFLIKASSFIRDFFRREKKRIDNQAVDYIINAAASNLNRIKSELEKISLFAGDKENITIEDCRIICSKTYELAIWSYSEALAYKNLKEALFALNIYIENPPPLDKNPELSLVYNASRRFKDFVLIKAVAEKLGINGRQNYNSFTGRLSSVDKSLLPAEIATSHPFKVFKLYENSMNFSETELAEIFTQLMNANIELVSGNQNSKLVLENLTSTICRRNQKYL